MRVASAYQEYRPGKSLEEYADSDRIPLLQMHHLRQLDFRISRRISPERTVDEFLFELAVNDMLRPLRQHKEMVILLDAQGALIREHGVWSLLFIPNRGELQTLDENAELWPVLQNIYEKEEQGEVCRVQVPDRPLRALMAGTAPFIILDEYCKHQEGGYRVVAEEIVTEGPEKLFSHVPVLHYGALTTVDKDEIEKYHAIKALFDDYVFRYSQRKKGESMNPLSVAIFGPPGSGKSFGVRQMAASCGDFQMTSLNLSQYSDPEQLFRALHHALHQDEEKLPLIFFDEFDAELSGVSRGWMKYFLAPMQDGEYNYDGSVQPIPGAIFVFAGATASSFREFLPDEEETEKEAFRRVKGPDFVSRLTGILNIKGPNPLSQADRSHLLRRALLLREQITRKVPALYDRESGRINISRGLLSALLNVSVYRHGARSMEFILDMSRLSHVTRFTPSCLPVDEQLDIHLDVEDFQRRLAFEQMVGDQVETYAKIAHGRFRENRLQEAERLGASQAELDRLSKEDDMKVWSELDEFYREGYRSQFRYIGEQLQDFNVSIGMRPILPGSLDAITELFGPALEQMANLEHERWMRDKYRTGWHYGPKDSALKTSPELVPFEELPESTKEFIRVSVRSIPANLKQIGYELYKKSSL